MVEEQDVFIGIKDFPSGAIKYSDIGIKDSSPSGQVQYRDRLIPRAVYDRIEKLMTEKELLFKKFFDQGYSRAYVKDMTIQQVIEWEEELAEIAFEARATQQGVSKARKERESGLTKEERDKLITTPELGVSDSINAVKRRKDRMSKADKLVETLRAAKVPEDEIKKILGNIKVSENGDGPSVPSNVQLVDKREVVRVEPKSNNTQAALLDETAGRLLEQLAVKDDNGVKERATLVGHLAFKVDSSLKETTSVASWNPFSK